MLNNLTLTNFMQHEALTVNFTPGLNALRGANEAGKSSIFVAIAYAFYGARALPMSMEDTVTWTKPVSTLRVDLAFSHTGLNYTIARRKSGAELLGPDGLRVSGQSEVTSYIENLFGASLTVAVATMIAGQSELKDSLDGSAVSLIEKLSNVGLIDQLVTKVQANLPCGNTKLFETQLAALADLVEPVSNFAALEAAAVSADAVEYAAVDAAEALTLEYILAKAEADEATIRLRDAAKVEVRRDMLKLSIVKAVADQAELAPACSEAMSIEQLTALMEAQKVDAVTRSKWQLFHALPVQGTSHDRALADADYEAAAVRSKEGKAMLRSLELDRATVSAGIITQSACGLCGKDLTDVPEVVAVNTKATEKLAELAVLITQAQADITECESITSKWLAVLVLDRAQDVKLGQLVGYVIVDRVTIPATVTWSRNDTVSLVDTEDYVTRLTMLRKFQSADAIRTAKISQAALTAQSLQAELASLPVLLLCPQDAQAGALELSKQVDAQNATLAQHRAKEAVTAARHALTTAQQAHSFAVERHAAAVAKRTELADTIALYCKNNRLVAKLRDARPIVAKQLWGTVLAAVSTYCSTIRGTPSIVTRSDTEFMIDGKPAKAYSGSAKDALGLAIRITLQKTFLGAMDFMLADEPASAADPVRESAMLGMLATCGYSQVILVTHSELADSFAANIIQV